MTAKSPFSTAVPAQDEVGKHDAGEGVVCRDWNGNEPRWDACGKGDGARRVSTGESVGQSPFVIESRPSLSIVRCPDRGLEDVKRRKALLDRGRVEGAGEMARGTDS